MLRADSTSSLSSNASSRSGDTCWVPFTPHHSAPSKTAQLEVNTATASLTDLVRLAHLAKAVPAGAVLLADRIGVGCWQRPRHVKLYFDETLAPTLPARSAATTAAAELACETLAQLLQTTREQIPLPNDKLPAARILRQTIHALDRSRRPQTAASFYNMVRITGEALHRAHSARLPLVQVQIPQSPTECLLHWIDALRAAQQTPLGATDPWLEQIETAARRRWMQHDLTLTSVRSYFAAMRGMCSAEGATGLASIAEKIGASLPTNQQEKNFDTRLNDNLYGRVFETRLMAHLIAEPAPGTLIFAQQLATSLLHFFSALPLSVKSMVAKELSPALVAEPRFWFDQVPLLRRFITTEPGEKKKSALVNWLSTPPESGYDCMAIALFTCQLSPLLKEKASSFAPWMWAADLNYRQIVQPSSRRLTNTSQRLLRPEGGILLLHQRPAFSHPAMRAGMRATLQHRPNLETRSAVTKRALDHGLPYASGVSGSTNILLHQAVFFRQSGIELDTRHLLLLAVMLLNGGHSVHEVLWMAHQLDRPLGLGLALSDAAPEEFVSDYDRFTDLFNGADRSAIERAIAAAWDDTIDYARMPIN